MAESKPPKNLTFNYVKSPQYRTIHLDGILGGVTPKGDVFLSLYSERFPIPQQMVHEFSVTEGGSGVVGKELIESRVSRVGIVREVEVGVRLTLPVAREIHKWLGERLNEIEANEEPK